MSATIHRFFRRSLKQSSIDTGAMRVLLFKSESGEYFQGPDSWTADPMLAYDFGGTVHAAQAVYEHRLNSVEIILAFEETHLSNMHLPIAVPI